MKITHGILGVLLCSSTVTQAMVANTYGCLMAQEERKASIEQLELQTSEKRQILKQCIQSGKDYWFTTELYLTARSFGDSHTQALTEFLNYKGIDYSISDYVKLRKFPSTVKATVKGNRDTLKLLSKLPRR